MLKFIITLVLFFTFSFVQAWGDNTPVASTTPTTDLTDPQLIMAYNYAYSLYEAMNFAQAKDLFRKLAAATMQPTINADSLFYYSQCAFRTGDYEGCIKGLDLLAKRWPDSPPITKGYVTQFATFLINEVTAIQTNWDYYRYTDGTYDEKDQPVWKESVPVGYKINQINFKLGFGLYRILQQIQPNSPETLNAKQKLEVMLNEPLKVLWVDEKAPANRFGHPEDFYSVLSKKEKEHFSKVICQRIFYDWQTDKLYEFFNIYDDVQNFIPKFVANTKLEARNTGEPTESPSASNSRGGTLNGQLPPPAPGLPATDPTAVLTLANLFQVAGYNPYTDTFTNPVESSPILPGT